MSLKSPDVYNANHVNPMFKVGTILDGPPDSVYGRPTKFIYVQHVNAVAPVSGHKASWTVLGTQVTNDEAGGATASLGIAAGAYVSVPTANYYTWIQTAGYHPTLLGDGSVAAGEGIAYDAADGTWDTITTGEKDCGQCLLADTGSPATFPGILNVEFSG